MAIGDIDAFDAALERQGAGGGKCPACGVEDWAYSGTPMILKPIGEDEGIPGKGYPALALICDNCGFMRLHFLPALEQHGDLPAESPGNTDSGD